MPYSSSKSGFATRLTLGSDDEPFARGHDVVDPLRQHVHDARLRADLHHEMVLIRAEQVVVGDGLPQLAARPGDPLRAHQ